MDILLDREKIEAFAAYADRHELFDLFDALLSRLLIEKPADPLAWMIDALQKPEVPSIVICGPPSSGVASLCARVAQLYDCIHISTSALLQTAIERQTSLGNQAKPFIERGELVPDAIMLSLVTQRLEEPDAVTKGFVLDGFPRTREQAFAMQMRGLVVDHFVIIEIPDAVIIDRALQTRVDPLTKKLYHLTNNPPPARDADLLARLIHRRNDQEPQVRSRLAQYRRHLPAVATCFKKTARWVSSTACLEDGTPPTEKVVADVTAWVGTRRRTRAPRMFKILLQGLPGSGKSSVAKMVEERLGFVHVSPEKIVQEEVSSRSVWANELSPFIHKPDEVPSNIMSDLVIRRLKRPDCVQKGWILEGFPNTRQDADFLASHDIVPNRVIWLDASPETCLARLAHRRYDPTTGRPVNLLAAPAAAAASHPPPDPAALVHRPSDAFDRVQRRIDAAAASLRCEIDAAYGCRSRRPRRGQPATPTPTATAAGTTPARATPATPQQQQQQQQQRTTAQTGLRAAAAAGLAASPDAADAGLVQDVLADGLGERDAADGAARQPSLERVFERVEGALMKPVPIVVP